MTLELDDAHVKDEIIQALLDTSTIPFIRSGDAYQPNAKKIKH